MPVPTPTRTNWSLDCDQAYQIRDNLELRIYKWGWTDDKCLTPDGAFVLVPETHSDSDLVEPGTWVSLIWSFSDDTHFSGDYAVYLNGFKQVNMIVGGWYRLRPDLNEEFRLGELLGRHSTSDDFTIYKGDNTLTVRTQTVGDWQEFCEAWIEHAGIACHLYNDNLLHTKEYKDFIAAWPKVEKDFSFVIRFGEIR